MLDDSSIHLKVQNLTDCFATTDPLKEMSEVSRDTDQTEAALKWIALAVLHGINSNAAEVSLTRSADGGVSVTAEYRKAQLPSPGSAIGEKIIQAMRAMTHLEKDQGETTLAFGVRNNSMDLKIKAHHADDEDGITIVFP